MAIIASVLLGFALVISLPAVVAIIWKTDSEVAQQMYRKSLSLIKALLVLLSTCSIPLSYIKWTEADIGGSEDVQVFLAFLPLIFTCILLYVGPFIHSWIIRHKER